MTPEPPLVIEAAPFWLPVDIISSGAYGAAMTRRFKRPMRSVSAALCVLLATGAASPSVKATPNEDRSESAGCTGDSDLRSLAEQASRDVVASISPDAADRLLDEPKIDQHSAAGVALGVDESFPTLRSFDGASDQLVVVASKPTDLLSVEISVSVECSSVTFARDGDGLIVSQDGQMVGAIAPPWAYDSDNAELATRFEYEGGRLWQIVETGGATFPVVFDPTYSPLTCTGYYTNLNASDYLDLTIYELGWCPVNGMFQSRNGYMPVYAFETNVANDYGKVAVRQAGSCSPPATNTGPWWDFTLPCQAHDYCYDLRKAGFSGTVSDNDCDARFGNLMVAHCNDRSVLLRAQCYSTAGVYQAAVSAPGVVTNPDPEEVILQPWHTALASSPARCADVRYGSQSIGAAIDQYICTYNPNQKWTIEPAPGYPGWFYIRSANSADRCVRDYYYTAPAVLDQSYCAVAADKMWRVQGSFNANLYTFRPYYNTGRCWDVPYSSTAPGVQIETYPCYETSNQRWSISW